MHAPRREPDRAPRRIDRTAIAIQTLQRRFTEACDSLGIPLEEGFRLMQSIDGNALASLLRSAGVQEYAQQATEILRAQQHEHTDGGRIGPPLADRISSMVALPPYVPLRAVVDAVLKQFSNKLPSAEPIE